MKSSEKKHSLARSNYSLNATSVYTVSSAQQLSGRATTRAVWGPAESTGLTVLNPQLSPQSPMTP